MEKFKLPLIGAACAIAVVLFSVTVANLLYKPKPLLKRGYEIAIAADGTVIKKEEKIVDFATLMANADVDKGAKTSKKCASCHTFNKGGKAKVGPNLYNIIGKKRGSMPGFKYSKAMQAKGGRWDRESLDQFIKKPKDYLPGTKMGFAGLKKAQDRANLILFLEQSSK